MPVLAQDQIRAGHDEFLKYTGDHKFLNGQHYSMHTLNVSGNQKLLGTSSVYVDGNDFSFYMEAGKTKVNTVVSSLRSEEKQVLDITHKTMQEQKVHTLKYKIVFPFKEKMGVYVEVDQEASDIKIDIQKVITCVLKYAPEIYPLVMKCIQETNVTNCILNLIKPLTEVYHCIFEQTSAVQLPRGISEVKKSWSLSNNKLYQYIEIGNLNVIDKQVRITNYSSNITYLQVGADFIGSGVLKVYVVKATWMGSGGFSASGYVNLVCQN
jgi:hypothetical protein